MSSQEEFAKHGWVGLLRSLMRTGSGLFTTGPGGNSAVNMLIAGGGVDFTPSSYEANLTMDGSAQTGAIASGATKIQFANLGAATEAIRVGFGTNAAEAETRLTMTGTGVTGLANTGTYIPAAAEGGAKAFEPIGVPSLATHYAVANAVAADVQVVAITQGI